MSRKKPNGPEPPEEKKSKWLTLEEIKVLAEEAKGDPVKTKALMKTVVNQTIEQVQEELAKKNTTPPGIGGEP